MTVFRYAPDTSILSLETPHRPRRETLVGEQYEWGWTTPLAYRILQQPDGLNPYPKTGSASNTAFWNPIEHFMLYHLGWTDPAQGLLRWEREGFTSTHSVLRMMKAIWQDTGLLDDYLFERLRVGARPEQIAGWLKPSYKVRGGGFGDVDNLNSPLRKRRASRNHKHPDTAYGMHLDYERHNSAPTRFATSDRGDAPYFIWEDARSAVNHSYLFTTSMIGWYRIMMDGPLADFEQTRTPVTVINEALGTLGTFHRSPITGLAYVGDHDVHRWGNPNEGEQLLYA